MKHTLSWLAVPLLLCQAWAQDAAEVSPAKQRLQDLQAEYKQVIQTWQKQMQEAQEASETAKPDEKPKAAISMRPDFSELLKRHIAAAKEFSGDDAVSFLLPAMNMGEKPAQTREVIDMLLEHLDSDKLGPLGASLGYLDQMVDADYAKEVMSKIEKHGKNLPLLGWIAFQRNEKTLRAEPVKSDAYLAAKATVGAAIAKAGDKRLQSQFDELVVEVEKFGIGMAAPEITGMDLDGVAFKLSDYRGKVVFLDFWGDW
jgi:hypothetical protein